MFSSQKEGSGLRNKRGERGTPKVPVDNASRALFTNVKGGIQLCDVHDVVNLVPRPLEGSKK